MSQQATKLKQGLSGLYEFLTVLLDGILDSLLDHFLEVIFGCEKKLTAIWNICSVKDRNEFNPTVCPKPQGFGMFRSWFYGYHFPTTEQLLGLRMQFAIFDDAKLEKKLNFRALKV